MRIKNKLYFSPKYKFIEINLEDRNKLISAFQDRVEGYYLNPAKCLNRHKAAFATGAMFVITIDFLARIETGSANVGNRFRNWVEYYFREFEKDIQGISLPLFASQFYEDFRNGLVHEGRIKEASQFYNKIEGLATIDELIMVINPDFLLKAIISSFRRYIDKLKTNDEIFDKFKENLEKDFQKDRDFVEK